MGVVETEAVVLRTYKLSDADKIFLALTADAGLVRGVAKGARRLKSRFGAALEPYTCASLQYFEKEGRELVTLSSAEIQRSYFHLVKSEEIYNALQYISEMTIEFTPPRDPSPVMFRMVKACLEAISEEPEKCDTVLRYFDVWLLRLAGMLPDVKSCGHCGREFELTSTSSALPPPPPPSARPAFYRTGEVVYCELCAPASSRELSSALRSQVISIQKLSPLNYLRESRLSPLVSSQLIDAFTKPLIARALERENARSSSSPSAITQSPSNSAI